MTDRYAVIGNPIAHSKSPLIHTAFAEATRQDLEYTKIEGPLDGFRKAVDDFRHGGGRGMNVTAPFKLQAYAMATERMERAQIAGAANAMKFDGERIVVDNFDGVGLTNDIQLNLGYPMPGKRVLVLGAGGAARGALLTFLEQRPGKVVIANRHEDRARELAALFAARGNVRGAGYRELGDEGFDIVVNATSASLTGELPPVPATVFANDCLAYELVYGKGLTPFLRLAQNAGAKRWADGVGMLVEQAAEAFVWWRGVRPDTRPLIEKLTVPLV
ncbi:MAG: shikimate dehydrogenase [Betaproteobacteria bacterium]